VLLLLEEPAMNELLFEMAVGWSLGFGEVSEWERDGEG
jgi:hypothetical protein